MSDDKIEKPEPEQLTPGLHPRSYAEHMAWCKKRALEYLDKGDLQNAIASLASDLNKHPDTRPHVHFVVMLGMQAILDHDVGGVRRLIEGFR